MWQPDGWGFRARLGILVPHAAIGSESELAAMIPDGVSVHATRIPLGVMRAGGAMDPTIALEPVRAFADPPLIDDAAELLAAAPLHAIGFAFTSSSYVRGAADDEDLRRRLESRARGIPVAICSASAVLGLRAVGACRIALVDPPWFSPEHGPPLTYHADPRRWHAGPDGLILRNVCQGQDFVLDCADRPDAGPWLARLLNAPA